jgi:hypothetical protein
MVRGMSASSFTIQCRVRTCGDTSKASVVASTVKAPPGWVTDRLPNYEGETVAGTCPDHSETIRIAQGTALDLGEARRRK